MYGQVMAPVSRITLSMIDDLAAVAAAGVGWGWQARDTSCSGQQQKWEALTANSASVLGEPISLELQVKSAACRLLVPVPN